MMRMTDIILKKRDGQALSREEINFFVKGFAEGTIPDYQAAALLMAIYFRKMTPVETDALTHAMLHSGEVIDLSAIEGIKVDKHSTGGVGDKTTIVLAPLVASAGAKIAKMSGRGLGHTGGTLDKLSVFSGLNLEMNRPDFIRSVNDIGIAVCSQTGNLVPADKKLYALRDVTATVEDISLIAGSIMSKKLASGSDAIVLDVKTGSGAFMESGEEAFALAEELVRIGNSMGKKTVALVTQMEEPLGHAVGNAIEVKEAIQCLKGNGPEDLESLCLELGAYLCLLAKIAPDLDSAREILREKLHSGAALEKLKDMVSNQGGNPQAVEDTSLLPDSPHQMDLKAPASGYISRLDARTVGLASMLLGAGRPTKESSIDLTAGIYLHYKTGAEVKKGDTLATLYSSDPDLFEPALAELISAYAFSDTPPDALPLILGVVGS